MSGAMSRPAGTGRLDLGDEDVSGARRRRDRLVGVRRGEHEQIPAVRSAQHAGEARLVGLDLVDDASALGDQEAHRLERVGHPDVAVGVEADAVGRPGTEIGPDPPVVQRAVAVDVERA